MTIAYDDSNIFARILRGEIPCKIIYEDAHVLAFHDAFPKAPTHILVIPKGAYTDIADFGAKASAEEIAAFHRAVAKIAEDTGLKQAGFRSIANTGADGGQEVPHFHLHMIGGAKLGAMIGA